MAVLGHTTLHLYKALERGRLTSVVPFKKVLLVEPDRHAIAALEKTWSSAMSVTCCTDFHTGRRTLLEDGPDLLVTNLHLRAFNGLHLVYLASRSGLKTRCITYADAHDPTLARETQSAGAFYERLLRLPFVPRCYAFQVLPPADRRDPGAAERRLTFRGGRRASEVVGRVLEFINRSTRASDSGAPASFPSSTRSTRLRIDSGSPLLDHLPMQYTPR